MRMIALYASLAFALTACDEGTPGTVQTATPTPTPTPSPTPTPGVGTVGAMGGTIDLPSVASVTFPANALSADAQVRIFQTATPLTDPYYGFITNLAEASSTQETSVQVTIGAGQPTAAVQVVIRAPAVYTASRPAGMATKVFTLIRNSSDDEESYDAIDVINPTVDTANSTVSFPAEPWMFSRKDSEGRRFASFALTLSPGAN